MPPGASGIPGKVAILQRILAVIKPQARGPVRPILAVTSSPPIPASLRCIPLVRGNVMIGGSNKMIGTAEVAELLGYRQDTIQKTWREMNLPGIKVGKYIRFRVRDIETWLDQKQKAST